VHFDECLSPFKSPLFSRFWRITGALLFVCSSVPLFANGEESSDMRPDLTVKMVGEDDFGKRLPVWINIMVRLKSVPIPTPAPRYVQRY
jgi:hypothetical protein